MSPVVDAPQLLTRAEAAKYLGIRPQTLALWACTHRYALPFVKVGSLCKYRREQLDKFLADRTIGG